MEPKMSKLFKGISKSWVINQLIIVGYSHNNSEFTIAFTTTLYTS